VLLALIRVGQLRQQGFLTTQIMARKKRAKNPWHRGIVFITGTDTGVGKTIFTALLLAKMRRDGIRALAMKPFCSGSREDVRVLQAVQANELPDEIANPFFFRAPLSPWSAAKIEWRKIVLADALHAISAAKKHCDLLLVEGAGGLLSPLGEGFCALDLIRKLRCPVVIVAPNRLGCIGQVMLVRSALLAAGAGLFRVALNPLRRPASKGFYHAEALRAWEPKLSVWEPSFRPEFREGSRQKIAASKKIKKNACAFLDGW
jgi:dethiobiotin synthetase